MSTMSVFKASIAICIAGAAYFTFVRPWYRHWGATAEEIARSMPLDDRIPDPTVITTRALTVQARPEQVWPWVVQMGEPPRAGCYSYTWIERLQGLKIENTDRILPEFQTLKVGDLRTMLEQKDFPLVNVHVPYEGETAKIDLFIPYDQIERNLENLPADKGAKLVLYCHRGGMGAIAVREGYADVWNLDGGMIAWREAGYPLMQKQ